MLLYSYVLKIRVYPALNYRLASDFLQTDFKQVCEIFFHWARRKVPVAPKVTNRVLSTQHDEKTSCKDA